MANFEVPEDVCGPAMLALKDDRRRKFAYLMGLGDFNQSEAARHAGYSDVAEAAKVRGHHLMQDETVIAAIREVATRVLGGLAPVAIRRARDILDNPKHPAHARIVETILDRTGFSAKTEHKVTVEHTANVEQLEAWARQYALDRGLAADALLPSGKLIEGQAVEVKGE